MVLPAFLLFLVFALGPLLVAFPLSFTEWNGLGPITWAGLDNWGEVLRDPIAFNAMRMTLVLTVFSWLLQTPISLLAGVYLAGRGRYRAVLGVIYFIPLLLSTTAVAITWSNLLDPNFGGVNATARELGLTGLASINWLGKRDLALVTVLLVVAWTFIPFNALLYQAGARQIARSLYEAAQLDGASRSRQFRHITLPLLRYSMVTSSMLIIVGSDHLIRHPVRHDGWWPGHCDPDAPAAHVLRGVPELPLRLRQCAGGAARRGGHPHLICAHPRQRVRSCPQRADGRDVRTRPVSVSSLAVAVLPVVWLVIVVVPIYYMVVTAIRPSREYLTGNPWLPSSLTWDNFVQVLDSGFAVFVRNSVIVTIGVVVCQLVVSLLAAYGINRSMGGLATRALAVLLLGLAIPSRRRSSRCS